MADDVYLLIAAGPAAGRRIALPEGQALLAGKSPGAGISLPEDTRLSGLHFSIGRRGDSVEILDLDSTLGTHLNGRKIRRGDATDGDTIEAGGSTFTLHVGGAGRIGPAGNRVAGESLRDLLFERNQPLYTVLDAARDKRIRALLASHDVPHHSLYEGRQGEELGDFAPYLARVYPDSTIIEDLLTYSWGNSWGIFLRCSLSILEVRRHFRHFLMVKDETGEDYYFRFYDPRVLRVFLPTCTRDQRLEFFGPVEDFLMEDEERGRVLVFSAAGECVDVEVDAPRREAA